MAFRNTEQNYQNNNIKNNWGMFECHNALKHFTGVSLVPKDRSNELKFTLFSCQRVYISLKFISVDKKSNDCPNLIITLQGGIPHFPPC